MALAQSSFTIDLNQVKSVSLIMAPVGTYVIFVKLHQSLIQISSMLRDATPRSLLLIDEFGKGTSVAGKLLARPVSGSWLTDCMYLVPASDSWLTAAGRPAGASI